MTVYSPFSAVVPINTATNTAGTPIPVGGFASAVAVTPDGKTAYVASPFSNIVTPINTAGAPIPVGSQPYGIAVTPDGKTVYVTNEVSNTVTPINTATNTAGAPIPVGTGPTGVAVTPDGKTVYVVNTVSGTVTPINTATNTAGTPIALGFNPLGVAISPDVGAPIAVAGITLFSLGMCSNGNALLASGLTFKANTSGALACTLASGPAGSLGPVFTGGTLQFAGANITSARPISLQAAGGRFDTSGNNATLSGTISGPGSLTKIGAGTLTLSGSSTYTGATNVNAGTLVVDGSTATSSLTTVNTGATLAGSGIVGNTTIAGGTLAPGSAGGSVFGPLTVQGSLSFTAASTYMIQVTPANAGRTNVSGMATLGGATVNAVFAPGGYIDRQYTILTATGGVAGTFNPAVTSNMANLQSTLSYDANDVFLNIKLSFVSPGGLNGNQQNVANALTSFFNANGSIPAAFATLGPAGLSQASGETATGSQQSTFDAMNLFMGLLTDPFVEGRGNPVSSSSGAPQFAEPSSANAYAATGKTRTRNERDAYAAVYRKAPVADPLAQRWSVWAAGFGGSQTTDGNIALGSNTATSRVYGTAVGADYRFSPFTLAGFALAGGGTNFSIANGFGSGRSDLFQAGAFIRHTVGPAYVSAALAYGWQDITTDRTVTIAGVDQLRAKLNANAWSGRLEGGYRFVAPWMGVGLTPYAAAQFTTFDLPAYAEQVLSGANTFALAYASKSVTAPRSELGIRTDKSYAMPDSILTLRGRLAWAHDYNPDRNIAATFQTLPGASFVVNGAAQAHDAALTTASAEMKWLNGFSLAATFEGEFSNLTRSYAGKGVARYTW